MASSIITVAAAGDPKDFRVSEALAAHDRGWLLVPVDGKIPVQTGWSNAEPASREQVESWAEQFNVAVRTGKASGVIVIDDDNHGERAATELDLPATVTVQTGGGGHHYYFRAPGFVVKNSASELLDRVDVRGDGGLVVLPGGIHPETSNCYRWAPGLSPGEQEFAELPRHLVEQLRKGNKRKSSPTKRHLRVVSDSRAERYCAGALDNAVQRVMSAESGTRNDTLNGEAFSMGRYVAGGLLDEGDVRDRLSEAARSTGLPEGEVAKTISSGLVAGKKEPVAAADLPLNQDESGGAEELAAVVAETARPKRRPTLLVLPGDLDLVVDQALHELSPSRRLALFQRGTQVVRVLRTKAPTVSRDMRRRSGSLLIHEAGPDYLVDVLTRAFAWMKENAKGEQVPTDCPKKIVMTILARAGQWPLDSLTGVLEAPTLRLDGSLLETDGYDEETGLYLDLNGLVVPLIPKKPTIDDARVALTEIEEILCGFPFVEASDLATALSAILTALTRKVLRAAPMFVFRAPKMASGKSLLADVVALVATGRPAAAMSQGRDDEEIRKRLFSILLEGESVACIDNVDRPLESDTLCSVLTQEFWKDRILGKSETTTVSTKTTWMATGNNLTVIGDLTTRVLPCDLDPKVERPEEREFKVNLHTHIPSIRGRLVAAGLTVLRAYIEAGMPSQGLSVFGRFEEWSDLIRSALVWAGRADPCDGRVRIEKTDPVRQQLVRTFSAWHAAFGDRAMTIRDLLQALEAGSEDPKLRGLQDALLEVAHVGVARICPRRLGAWLAKHAGRWEGGFHVEQAGTRSNSVRWRVVRHES